MYLFRRRRGLTAVARAVLAWWRPWIRRGAVPASKRGGTR